MRTPLQNYERRATFAAAVMWISLLGFSCSAPAKLVPPQNRAPSVAQVRDGLSADADQQESRSSLAANWDDFLDPEGQNVAYEWSIGSSPGATDVMGWRQVGANQFGSSAELDLPPDVTLHSNVRAIDPDGVKSMIASSDGIIVIQSKEPLSLIDKASQVPIRPGHFASVNRHGISWTFDRPGRCGRYINGDWWVLGPIGIVNITPSSVREGARVRHGSMINPSPTSLRQGYDSAMFGNGRAARYNHNANVALDVSSNRPLAITPGMSIVSTVSHPLAGQLPQIESCAVLTCVAKIPPANAFRPPYCGRNKSAQWTTDSLDMTQFARLPAEFGAPAISDLVERFERTWLDHLPGYAGRYLHPRQNMPNYGRDLAELVGVGALTLQLDLPIATKRPLVIAMVQLGIDTFGIIKNGGRFPANGGNGSGRKFPLLLAGSVLHDDGILRLAQERKFAFAEDAQTFYVTQSSKGEWNQGHGGYDSEDQGLPEWGNRHIDDPSQDRKAWTADPYRRCCTANVWHGYVLAARIMGLRDAWDHPALFDYVDRYMQIETKGSWMRGWNPFSERMWDRYRRDF